jgi:murein L,D-transpeptidase YcbB/YkuD
MPEPVPVYITYLTAQPEGATIAFRSDVYNRDGLHLAKLDGRSLGTQ